MADYFTKQQTILDEMTTAALNDSERFTRFSFYVVTDTILEDERVSLELGINIYAMFFNVASSNNRILTPKNVLQLLLDQVRMGDLAFSSYRLAVERLIDLIICEFQPHTELVVNLEKQKDLLLEGFNINDPVLIIENSRKIQKEE